MPYANIVFAKLEKRILNDPRWFMLSESAQLNYIRLILAACETYNRIPKNPIALKKMFRTELTEEQLASDLVEITKSFPKLKENGEFYFFEDFHEKTNYIPKEIQRKSKGNPKDGTEEEEEEEEKNKNKNKNKKNKNWTPPTLEEVSAYCFERKNTVDPDKWHSRKLVDNFPAENVPLTGESKVKERKEKKRKEYIYIPKTKHLEAVLLSQAEFLKLEKLYGMEGTREWIEKLNEGIMARGYKYKSHYHAILSWARRDKKSTSARPLVNRKADGLTPEQMRIAH